MLELDRNALVWGITGNLGGGKSLTATYFMVNAIRNGFFVVSNITLSVDKIGPWASNLYLHVDFDEGFDPYKLPCGDPRGSGGRRRVLVVFDECAEWFDQYANAKDPRIQRLWSWLRHSSKRSQDVFLIIQRPEYLHKVLRILIARWLVVDDLAVWRIPLCKMRLPFCSGLCVCRPYDRSGQRIGHAYFISKSKWGRFYNTAECLNSDGAQFNSVYQVPDMGRKSTIPFWVLYFISLFFLFSMLYRQWTNPPRLPAPSGVGGRVTSVL